ncbi:MAG: PPC domain-containing protein [Pirellulaceae bacterium]
MVFVNPALYLDGVTSVRFSPGIPITGDEVTLADAPQPFARLVNNTIFGADGNLSNFTGSGTDEPNDTIAGAVVTHQGSSVVPAVYTTQGFIGDSPLVPGSQDVDLYRIELAAGDRVEVDIDTSANSVDTVLRLFDSAGRPAGLVGAASIQSDISNEAAAPGEALSFDPYLNFTAVTKGVYYIGVSSEGNQDYDPLSLAGRQDGVGTGSYSLNVQVSAHTHSRWQWMIWLRDKPLRLPTWREMSPRSLFPRMIVCGIRPATWLTRSMRSIR